MFRLNLFRGISDFIIYSNLYVALPVSGLAMSTFILNNIPFSWPIISVIYFSTLSLYNIHRLVGIKAIEKEYLRERHQWSLEHQLLVKLIILIALLSLCLSLYSLEFQQLIHLLVPGFIAFGYTIPIYRKNGQIRRFRDIPFIKIILVSLTVAYITVIFPLSYYQPLEMIFKKENLVLLSSRILFVFAITIPFDIRDLKFDLPGKINTLPMVFGIDRAKQIGLFALLLFSALSMWQFFRIPNISFVLLISAIVSGWVINACREDSSEYYFSFLAEGTMLIQMILVLWAWLRTSPLGFGYLMTDI